VIRRRGGGLLACVAGGTVKNCLADSYEEQMRCNFVQLLGVMISRGSALGGLPEI